jgi:hypothetical protein
LLFSKCFQTYVFKEIFPGIFISVSPKTGLYTVKKGNPFSCPQPGCHFPNSPWARIIKLLLVRESLVSDIQAGDGKTANLFFTVY